MNYDDLNKMSDAELRQMTILFAKRLDQLQENQEKLAVNLSKLISVTEKILSVLNIK